MNRILAAALVAGAMGLATITSAAALDRRIKIINSTGQTLTNIYASNVGEEDWQEDMLGSGSLGAGDSVIANLNDGSGYCKFDLKAVFEDGQSVVRRRVNICEVEQWEITD
jgi:hypothetical protein